MRNIFKVPNEKGAVIVFFAITLPLFLMLVGGAIDFGNAYIHKSRLQNAADAAALAGARVFAIKGETIYSHTEADREAGRYVAQNAESSDGSLPSVINTKEYKAGSKDNVIYYKVHLTEEVPFYFLRILGDRFKTIEIAADAVAAISSSAGGYEYQPGRDLFLFKHNFDAVNSVVNPDDNSPGVISNVFNGNVAFTDGSGNNPKNINNHQYTRLEYSTQKNSLSKFFSQRAKDENLSAREAVAKGNDYAFDAIFEDYDMTYIRDQARKEMGLPEYSAPRWQDYVESGDWDEYNAKNAEYKQYFKMNTDENDKYKHIYSSMLSNDLAVMKGNADNIDEIIIDSAIPGDVNDPVYLYIDETIEGVVNVKVKASNVRPLIIVCTNAGKFHVDINDGVTFSGVFYAPNTEDVLVNAQNGNFEGTMIVGSVTLRGDNATYTYKNYIDGQSSDGKGANTGAGSGKVSSGSTIKLNIPADDITWY